MFGAVVCGVSAIVKDDFISQVDVSDRGGLPRRPPWSANRCAMILAVAASFGESTGISRGVVAYNRG